MNLRGIGSGQTLQLNFGVERVSNEEVVHSRAGGAKFLLVEAELHE
ncbi:MAG: hypothetical protein QOH28_2206 [Actinomycetota bacterium]|nr:hypothetical protein [Actinomycetota bacterium]